MKKIICKKKLVAGILSAVLMFGMNVLPVSAASSGDWYINYIPNGPAAVSNRSTTVVVDYYSGGYYAYCSNISGANGRALSITSSSAGGMSPVPITATGKSQTWKMKGSSSNAVTFKVSATSGYSCNSSGTIYINN